MVISGRKLGQEGRQENSSEGSMGLRQRISVTEHPPFRHLRVAAESSETEMSSEDRERASPQSFIESDQGEKDATVFYVDPSRTACSERL